MRESRKKRWVLGATAAAITLSMAIPANSQGLVHHTARGSGTDGLGNSLRIFAAETALGFGTGVAFVRLANESGPAQMVLLTCLTWDERPGNGFHFLYSNGITLSGRRFYIGVFDDHGAGRPGPYDVIYTQTSPVAGPCNVAAVSSYPIGWDPVSTGDFIVN